MATFEEMTATTTATEIKNTIKAKLLKDFEQIIFQEYGDKAGRIKAGNTKDQEKDRPEVD